MATNELNFSTSSVVEMDDNDDKFFDDLFDKHTLNSFHFVPYIPKNLP